VAARQHLIPIDRPSPSEVTAACKRQWSIETRVHAHALMTRTNTSYQQPSTTASTTWETSFFWDNKRLLIDFSQQHACVAAFELTLWAEFLESRRRLI
jgi:hypothetical protein